MSEREVGIQFNEGVVWKKGFASSLSRYQILRDNPLHCLALSFGQYQEGTVCIYEDEIGVLPRGKDGFTVKFAQKVPFSLLPPPGPILPDPEKQGKEYQSSTRFHAIKMDKHFQVGGGGDTIQTGKPGDYLVKQNGRTWIMSAERMKDYEVVKAASAPAEASG
jgi:hypothetical protein